MLDIDLIEKKIEKLRDELSNDAQEIIRDLINGVENLLKLNEALADLVDYYEGETDRYNFDEEDIPEELKELEKDREIAEFKLEKK
jgi:hypothetical protein